jgi:hypothetical protein
VTVLLELHPLHALSVASTSLPCEEIMGFCCWGQGSGHPGSATSSHAARQRQCERMSGSYVNQESTHRRPSGSSQNGRGNYSWQGPVIVAWSLNCMTEDAQPIQCSYTTVVSGDASFFRDVGAPLAHALDMDLRSSDVHKHDCDLDDALKVNGQARNEISSIAGIITVVVFFASYIGKKILDDVYTAKLQPIIKRILGQTDNKLTQANARNKKVYQLGVWYEQKRVLVLASIVGDSFNDILKHQELLPTIHASALTWIKQNGRQKAIHLYILEGGNVNAAPLLFESLA